MKAHKKLGILKATTQLSTQKKVLDSCGRKSQKISCKTFPRKSYFTYFCKIVQDIIFKIVNYETA